MRTYLADEAACMTVGQMLSHMLADLPEIPVDEVRMTIEGCDAAVEWDRVIVRDGDGQAVIEDDEIKTVESHGSVLLRLVSASWQTRKEARNA